MADWLPAYEVAELAVDYTDSINYQQYQRAMDLERKGLLTTWIDTASFRQLLARSSAQTLGRHTGTRVGSRLFALKIIERIDLPCILLLSLLAFDTLLGLTVDPKVSLSSDP
jgi:hypothetical protein